jgi:RimJ/RimL family protein N-acetyltransferase/acyl carrier protein
MSNIRELGESDFYNILDSNVPGGGLVSAEQENSRVYFTRLAMSGLGEMHEYSISDKRFYDYLEYEPFKSIEDTEAYLKRLIGLEVNRAGRTAMGWFIRKTEDHKVIGTARLVNIDYKRQSVVWGYGLDPRLWGRGYVQEVQRQLLDYIFNRLCLNRLYGSAMLSNKQTISTLISIGMKEEGVHPKSMRNSKGIYCDSWSYGMLYEDYKKSRACISSHLNLNEQQNENKKKVDEPHIESMLREFLDEYSDINIDFPFADLPYWDSLKQMELVVFLETKVGYAVTIDQILQFNSIRSVIGALVK